jgi:small-conductance mechanosensitive channel
VLEQSRANLAAWKSSVTEEYNSILHSLLLRVLVIAVALCVIVGGGELWSRATNKYVRDIRRRRQFLIVRRFVVGFLSLIVIVFGFVTQFNSLATFAGFITAGIAVGLQTVLLSVAAYFFIIGRYGIKVGDRITIASVTGDVVDVGIVRFYLMELAGTGTSLNPTGRIAVFSNAVLFQAGTPLYKQIPGTEYAWHELIVKLTDAADYKMVCEAVMKEVHAVYEEYRLAIERQHAGAESAIQASIDPPVIESRLQFTGGSFQLWARFPVQFEHASEADEKVIRALLDLISRVPEIKAAVAATPVIQASVRG